MNVRVDFTPMVDMLMLLITFFMLCTTLSKPQTMELTMPSNDENQDDTNKNESKASQTVTLYVAANDKVYYGSNNNDVNIINAENHENLPTYESGKGFYLSKDNTWVFTLTEGDDGSVTLTVSPETAGETKYMITTDLNTETEDVFDANYQLTKEMTTEPFFIVRSDDYGLFEVTSKDRNEPNGYLWFVFSEDATTAHFEVGKRENMYAVSKADSYTFTLDLENKTVTAVQVKDEL